MEDSDTQPMEPDEYFRRLISLFKTSVPQIPVNFVFFGPDLVPVPENDFLGVCYSVPRIGEVVERPGGQKGYVIGVRHEFGEAEVGHAHAARIIVGIREDEPEPRE